jgi:hypothetical protein
MGDVVEIRIPVDADAAAALADLRTREVIGRIVSRMLQPQSGGNTIETFETSILSHALSLAGVGEVQTRRRLNPKELHADYAAMAADEEAEADAAEWIEGLVSDVATEPSRHDR